MNENLEKLINFTNPENLKGNLICCSLYMAFFETTKDYIIEQPRSFFSIGFSSESGEIIGPSYKEKVLSKDIKSILNSSILWFKENGALTSEEIDMFYELKKYRNVVAHEMFEKLFDGLDSKFAEYFANLIDLRIKLERWWLFNIELPTNDDFENASEMREEDVMASSQIIYKLILDVLSDDEEKSKYYYSEFLKFREGNK